MATAARNMSKRTRKIRKQRIPEDVRIARSILPEGQARPGAFEAVDISNHSDDDQRALMRAKGYASDKEEYGARRTVRRLTRVELMRKAGAITAEQTSTCAWYADQHELGFQTVGCTANYAGVGCGGFGSQDLLARYKAQGEARENYFYARLAIPVVLRDTFERVVLGSGRPPHMMPKAEKLRFSMAAFLLHQQIGHLLAEAV